MLGELVAEWKELVKNQEPSLTSECTQYINQLIGYHNKWTHQAEFKKWTHANDVFTMVKSSLVLQEMSEKIDMNLSKRQKM